MTQPVLEMELRAKDTDPIEKPAPVVGLFERLALDPNVSVEKLERLIEMQRGILRDNARSAFNAAFSRMQPEIPIIDEHGRIEVKGSLRSTYAPLEDIHEVVKPILAKWGFAIRHRTEWPADKPNIIRVVGILSHADGHAEDTVFEAPADKSDYRSDIQSMGSTVSYGRRYTTLDLLNISTRREDNDGARQPAREDVKAPNGFEEWWTDMLAVADNGVKALTDAWNASKQEYRRHLLNANKPAWDALKTKAKAVRS